MRFPEFKDEWKKYKADTIFQFFSTNSLSWSELTYESGNIKNYHYGLIHRSLPILTDVNDDRIPFLINDEDRKNKELVKKGDLIFADASEDYNGVGQAIEIISDSIPAVSGLHTIHAREKKNLTSLGFKGYLFNSAKIKNQLRRLAVGTKVYGISSKHFKDVNVNIPQDKNEQMKITLFLSAIDNKIEIQRKLIDLYKSLIKTLREKLFSFQSNNLLGNEINFINGYAFSPKTYDINGKYYVCTISNVSGDKYLDLTQVNRVSEIPKDLNINQQLFSGDILMSLTGNVGRISIVEYDHGLLNQRVAKIDVKNKDQSNFIYHVLSSEKFLKYVERQSQGSSQNNLYYKNIEKFALPNYDSNKRLLSILDKIDFLIINYSTLLQSLIAVKIFLLHNMFI